MHRLFLASVLFALSGIAPAFAQQGTADLLGRVLDAQGAILPGVPSSCAIRRVVCFARRPVVRTDTSS